MLVPKIIESLKYIPGDLFHPVGWGFYLGVIRGILHKMCLWLWGLLCFWDTQMANSPHSPAVGGVEEFVDCCIICRRVTEKFKFEKYSVA